MARVKPRSSEIFLAESQNRTLQAAGLKPVSPITARQPAAIGPGIVSVQEVQPDDGPVECEWWNLACKLAPAVQGLEQPRPVPAVVRDPDEKEDCGLLNIACHGRNVQRSVKSGLATVGAFSLIAGAIIIFIKFR